MCVLVKQSVSVLTAVSHARNQSQGILRSELLITPLCMIPLFNPGNRDLRAAWVTYFAGKTVLQQVQKVGWGGKAKKKKKESFQGDTKHSDVAKNP